MTSVDVAGIRTFYAAFFGDSVLSEFFGGSDYANLGYWPSDTTTAHAACDNLVDIVVRQIPKPVGQVLEVACGRGASSQRLATHFGAGRVVAINTDLDQLLHAHKSCTAVQFVAMDAAKLGFPDAT